MVLISYQTSQVCLSAMGWWDGSEVGGPGAGSEQLNYMSFGASVSEVRV